MKKRYAALLILLLAILLVVVGVLITLLINAKRQPKVTVNTATIEEKLRECSELTTAKLDYRGLIHYSEGDIPLINKKSFSMVYTAHASAGIDLSQAKITVRDMHITIKLPAAVMQDIIIDPESIAFYDEQSALFNWSDKTDVTSALTFAKMDAEEHVTQQELLDQAGKQAEKIINTLFQPILDSEESYTIEIIH